MPSSVGDFRTPVFKALCNEFLVSLDFEKYLEKIRFEKRRVFSGQNCAHFSSYPLRASFSSSSFALLARKSKAFPTKNRFIRRSGSREKPKQNHRFGELFFSFYQGFWPSSPNLAVKSHENTDSMQKIQEEVPCFCAGTEGCPESLFRFFAALKISLSHTKEKRSQGLLVVLPAFRTLYLCC